MRFLGDWNDFSKQTAVVTDSDICFSATDICDVQLNPSDHEYGWWTLKFGNAANDLEAEREYADKGSAMRAFVKLRCAAHYYGR